MYYAISICSRLQTCSTFLYYCDYNGEFFNLYFRQLCWSNFIPHNLQKLVPAILIFLSPSFSSSFDQILSVTLCLGAFYLGGLRTCSSLTFSISYQVSSLLHSCQLFRLLNISYSFYLSLLLYNFVLESLSAHVAFMGVGRQSTTYLTK